MAGEKEEVLGCKDILTLNKVQESKVLLSQDWGKIKSVFPVASGGLHPGHIPALVRYFGNDVILQFGGGCHGHPKGTKAGAKAIRQALDATMEGINLDEYSKTHKELAIALDKWGIVK